MSDRSERYVVTDVRLQITAIARLSDHIAGTVAMPRLPFLPLTRTQYRKFLEPLRERAQLARKYLDLLETAAQARKYGNRPTHERAKILVMSGSKVLATVHGDGKVYNSRNQLIMGG